MQIILKKFLLDAWSIFQLGNWKGPSSPSLKVLIRHVAAPSRLILMVQVEIPSLQIVKIVKVISQISHSYEPFFGEAQAPSLAISLVTSVKLLVFFTLEGDSQVVVMALQIPTIVQD